MKNFIFTVLSIALFTTSAVGDKDAEVKPQWPRQVKAKNATITLYQPQIEEWKDQQHLSFRLASSVLLKSKEKELYGGIWGSAKTYTDMEDRTVRLYDIKVTKVDFPSFGTKSEKTIAKIINKSFPDTQSIALDQLLAGVKRAKEEQKQQQAVKIQTDAPRVFVAQDPAMLVLIDGEPKLQPIEKTGLMHIVNSQWDILLEPEKVRFYLLYKNRCYISTDLNGDWHTTTILPAVCLKIPKKHPRKAFREMYGQLDASSKKIKIFVSKEPSELITLKGKINLSFVKNTKLLYVTNTNNDLFVYMPENAYYVLLAGRWFKTSKPENGAKWEFVDFDKLPKDFAKIPEDHPKASVLASVPGTRQAEEAVIMAKIPRQVVVKRDKAKVVVVYDGTPKFVVIKGTNIKMAVNTSYDVVLVNGKYYCCYQGVWFVANSYSGPWVVVSTVPSVVYTIPASCPIYHVTYVRAYSATAAAVVFGFTAGYLASYHHHHHGVVVYGTGHHYHGHYHGHHYHGYARTYGVSAHYNRHTGGYSVGRSYYTPYGSSHVRAGYNSHTGWYAASGYKGHNAYSRWGEGTIVGEHNSLHAGFYQDRNKKISAFETEKGAKGARASTRWNGSASVVKDRNNNVYLGRNGKVYKKDSGNNWQKYNRNGWSNVDKSNINRSNINKSNINKSNIHKSNIHKSNINRSNINRSNINRSNFNRSNVQRSSTSRNRGYNNTRKYQNWRKSSRYQSSRSRSRGRSRGGSRGGRRK